MSKQRKELTPEQAFTRLAALCATSEKCEQDVRRLLRRWGVSSVDGDKIVKRLQQENFLNGSRYVSAFVHDKFMFNGWGRVKIAHELKSKGIAGERVAAALDSIDEAAYREKLLEILLAKQRAILRYDRGRRHDSLLRYGLNRGFEADLVLRVVNSIEDDDEIDGYGGDYDH